MAQQMISTQFVSIIISLSIMFKVVTLLLILILVSSKTKTSNKKNPVFSVQNISCSLNQTKLFIFKNIDDSKALMINVEIQKQPTPFKEFQVTITDSNNKSTSCHFKYMNNLCVEQKPSQQIKVVITCLTDKCDFKLAFSQRSIIRSGDSTNFKKRLTATGQIYQLSKRKFNTILEIYAEREEYQVLSSQITVFSNIHAFPLSQAEELDANSAIYGLKPVRQDQDQYIYIHTTSKKSEFFKMWLRSHNGQLRDTVSIIDFIQTYGKSSGSNYKYVGQFKKNIQINVRVFSPKNPQEIPLTLKVIGKAEQQKQIRKLKFDSINFQGQKIFDFSYAITHKVHSPYKSIAFELFIGEVKDKSIFFEIEVRDVQSFQVNIFDHIYFGSQAKEELQFTVEPQVKMELADGDKDIQIVTNAKENYFSNTQTCSLHKGCNIQIKAESPCLDCSFKFNLKDEDIKNHIIYYQVQNNTIEGKVQIAQQIYFKYVMNGKAATQIVVNSKNVILYANFENYKRCTVPKASCHQYAINQENPMIVYNTQQKPTQLVIAVLGLEKTSFKARFINQINGLQIKLGQKFSYLMDDQEKSLQIRMEVKPQDFGDSKHIHFNLISPIHSLRMKVQNSQSKLKSMEGYITFDKQDMVGDLFLITIQKINLFYDQFVHFTLIVTTSDIPVRLDSTSTHYEQYNPKSQKKFLIEYQPAISNAINIYTQNLQKEKTSMVIHIVNSKDVEGEQVKPIFSKQLLRDYQFIDLDSELQQLQICDDSNCELELWIKNEGNSTLEQSITILEEQSVIGLDDSIWSVFQINELSKNNHFYFIPRKQNKSITVLFNTDDANLFIDYRIYNYKNSINPADWPFGHEETSQKHTANTQQINIQSNDPEILACWPTCAILININQINPQVKSDNSVIKSYKILATNSIIELPEDTKLDFTLRNQEEKVLFIVAKSIIMYSKLTFFTYYSFGRAKITISLTSGEKQFKMQNFSFQDLETVLQIEQIKALITKQQLKMDKVLIKISILAETNLKMTLQYSSLIKDIYRLRMDDLQVAALAKGAQIWYQFVPERDFSLKLYRMKGFPLFKIIRCNESDYIPCLNKNKNYIQMKTKQFVVQQQQIKANLEKQIVANLQQKIQKPYLEVFIEKAYEYSDEQCDRCIFFLWVYCFEGDLEMTINLRTKLSEIQLKEMSILNDRIQSQNHNRYLINIPHEKDALVTLRILQGTARVTIVKNSLTIYNQTHEDQNNLVQVTINAEQQQQQEDDKQYPQQKQHHFGKVKKFNSQHLFGHAHVTVTALSQLPVQLVISYSVGGSSIYLEDGIVVQKQMVPNVKHTFFYRNRNKKNKAYLTLSSQIQSFENLTLSKELSLTFYYYPDASNREVKETFKPELPPNRNQNYLGSTISHVYELPGKYELYEIRIECESFMKVTASVNHEQVVYLPLGFDYLIKLHPRQELNLVVDSPATEFLEVFIKKCDTTVPTLLYTNDAREFKKGIFEAEVQIDNIITKQFINVKKNSSTIHLKLKAGALTESLFTISVSSSSRQMRQNMVNYKPGNRGIVTYKMINIDTVQVSFKPILCNDKDCQVPFVYYLLVSQDIEQVYTDLNCANTYFIPMAQTLMGQGKKEIKVIDDKNYDKKRNEYIYRVKVQKQSTYIGVKGMISQTTQEVLYTPLQIRSFWGELANMSFGIILTVSLVLALLVTVVIVVSTKLARRGYKPISGDE